MPMLKIHQECERLKEEQGSTRLPPAGRRSRWTRQTSASFKLGPSIHDEQLRNSSHSLFFSLFRREEKFSSSFFCASGQPLSVPLLYAFASGWDICSWTECLTRRSTSGEWSSCSEHPLKKINWRFHTSLASTKDTTIKRKCKLCWKPCSKEAEPQTENDPRDGFEEFNYVQVYIWILKRF